MHEVARQVEAAAATDATVLLLGESGTGKSLVARILHHRSARRNGSFVELNCGAVAPTLIESELFGHARGAFTGADRARPGLFEEADRGTIFLDEVAELPPASQVKLLDVLERRQVRRVGRTVIGPSTSGGRGHQRDLTAAVRDGRFREDLFYRLNVLSFRLPPLRRKEDILALARKFLEDSPETTGACEASPTPGPCCGAWPGNVRSSGTWSRAVQDPGRPHRTETSPRARRAAELVLGIGDLRFRKPWRTTRDAEALRQADGVAARAAGIPGVWDQPPQQTPQADRARASTWVTIVMK
jgi:two-component system response regulator AtoC